MRIEVVRGQLGAELISNLARNLHDRRVHEKTIAVIAIARRETMRDIITYGTNSQLISPTQSRHSPQELEADRKTTSSIKLK
jgi:hypothetical protein